MQNQIRSSGGQASAQGAASFNRLFDNQLIRDQSANLADTKAALNRSYESQGAAGGHPGSGLGSAELGPYEAQVLNESQVAPGMRNASQDSDHTLRYSSMLAAANIQVHSQSALMRKSYKMQS